MKKFVSILILSLFLAPSLVRATTQNTTIKSDCCVESMKVKTFKGTITLSGGCVVDYVITIDYSIIPPAINSIHGSVTLSGPCSGTQTFRMSANTDESGNVIRVDSDLTLEQLPVNEFNHAFVKELNDLNLFQRK